MGPKVGAQPRDRCKKRQSGDARGFEITGNCKARLQKENARLKNLVEGDPRANIHRNPDTPKSEVRTVTGKRSTRAMYMIEGNGFWPPHSALLRHAGLMSGDCKMADTGQRFMISVSENIRDAGPGASRDLTEKA